MSNPGAVHVHAVKRILQCIKGTKELGLVYRRGGEHSNSLVAYADADHAGDPDTSSSVTGYLLLMNGAAVAWQ